MAFTQSDCLRLKLLRILETAGEAVLRYTLLCGTDGKPDDVCLDEYLKSLPYSSTASFTKMILKHVKQHPASSAELDKVLKKTFNDTDLRQIRNDPSCGAFDITLLHKAIRVACENVAETNDDTWTKKSSDMEYLVTKIKNLRNEVVHEKPAISEPEYLDEVKEIEDLFSKALEATKVRYNRDDSELSVKKVEVGSAVDDIVKEHVGKEEILRRSAKQLLPDFKKETDKEIRKRLDSARFLTPLHFLSGDRNTKVDVHNIFSKIIIMKEGKAEKVINHLKLMTLTQEGRSPASPHLMKIEGDAGSGKTTLLTFLLAEWLEKERDRRMEGLNDFDLLLWVVCRHETSKTLESFVAKALPDTFSKYRYLLLPLMKKCKILFAVDGLDEEPESSHRLIKDIMSHGNDSPNFTVVCTSRPEGLMGMEAITPQKFHSSHVRIEGIATDDRTDFVVKHVENLSRSLRGQPVNTASLRQVMQQISSKELFRLPLNLLFLSYMYVKEPQQLKTRITQTKLYQYISDRSVEKLHYRIACHQPIRLFETKMLNILRVIYEVSLQELLYGNIYLSEESLTHVNETCSAKKLPEDEVLSAFFCLRREVDCGRQSEKYSAPHKGVQEFFGAHYITGCLDKYKQGDIRRVLQGYVQGQDLKLPPLRNLFCHILGILSSHKEPKVMAMKEVVDLLHESGVNRTQTWLTVLADTDAHHYTMARIADHIRPRLSVFTRIFSYIWNVNAEVEHLTVHDGTVHVAAALLSLLPRKEIEIRLDMDPVGVWDVLCPALANHAVVELWLEHHFKHHPPCDSGHLLQQCPRNDMKWFKGHLHAEHLPLLPRGLRWLYLAVLENEEACGLLSALEDIREHCPELLCLGVHVPVSLVTADCLAPLPPVPYVSIILSAVGDGEVEGACRIAEAMCPRETWFDSIRFPDPSLGVGGYRLLLKGLEAAGMKAPDHVKYTPSIVVPDTAPITNAEKMELCILAKSLLGRNLEWKSKKYLWW